MVINDNDDSNNNQNTNDNKLEMTSGLVDKASIS